jgi:hypothetical protein
VVVAAAAAVSSPVLRVITRTFLAVADPTERVGAGALLRVARVVRLAGTAAATGGVCAGLAGVAEAAALDDLEPRGEASLQNARLREREVSTW